MRILTSAYGLDYSGVPTFTLAMYKELVSREHAVTVYSPLGGPLERKMRVVSNLNNVTAPSVIIAQNNVCAETLHKKFPDTPLIFYSHGIWGEMEQPPSFSADHYIAINEAVLKNMQYRGVNIKKLSIVRDFVDTTRFTPSSKINKKLKNVLFISNYKKWNNYKAVSAACERLGVSLKCVGSPYGRSTSVEKDINNADLVISWGRGIIEAMSCGRAVLSFDKLVGDGYINEQNYYSARRDNFCGYLSQRDYASVEELIDEIKKYNYMSGEINRALACKYHDATLGTDQIMNIIKKLIN